MSQDFRLTRIEQELAEIKRLLLILITKDIDMATSLDNLKDKVARTLTVEQSAQTLIQGIAQQLRDLSAGANPALDDLAAQLDKGAGDLASAVTANTPAAPPADTGSGSAPAPTT